MDSKTLHTIWKYPLGVYDSPCTREIKVDCVSVKPLSVAEQHGDVTLWALVEVGHCRAGHAKHTLSVDVIGTGHLIDMERLTAEGKSFIGTVVADPFVWHIYAESEGRLSHTCEKEKADNE